jgi:hypothetical protein
MGSKKAKNHPFLTKKAPTAARQTRPPRISEASMIALKREYAVAKSGLPHGLTAAMSAVSTRILYIDPCNLNWEEIGKRIARANALSIQCKRNAVFVQFIH